MEENSVKRDGFQSKWGFILACIGSAVGMGNIWRFPIMVHKFGGLTFLLPYFIFVVLIGASGVIEEFSLGRWAKAGPVGAFEKGCATKGKGNIGKVLGYIPIIGALMLAIGYTVVMGWIFKYTFLSITGELYGMGTDMNVIGGTFGATAPEAGSLGEALSMMFSNGIFGVGNGVWQIIGLAVAVVIMVMGIAGGIEKANKVMMPILFALFVVLGIYIFTLEGSGVGYSYIFTLKPEGLANPQVWVFAFGQAFFSLSVAGNGSVIYGSYLSDDEDVVSSARNVAIFDTLAALLAAFVIIPAMAVELGEGINSVGGGPGLMFVYLVNVFNAMPGGRIVGMIFYIAVLFAGISSIVNLYEAPIAFLQEELKLQRKPAVLIIAAIGIVVSLLIQPWTSQWMDVVSIYICPLGAALAGAIFFFVMDRKDAEEAVGKGAKKPVFGAFWGLGKVYVILAIIALVLGAYFGGIG
ncbi:MAG: sodium-dependent transporter [Lachnospiraceae bacterium]|nr:sodium-dependent transporter [Lachnospiraceae bacterium]